MSISIPFISPVDQQARFARQAEVLKRMQELSCLFYAHSDPDWETLRQRMSSLMEGTSGKVERVDCARAMQAFRGALAALYPSQDITIELTECFLSKMQQSAPSNVCTLEVAIQWCCGSHLKYEVRKRKWKKRRSALQKCRGALLRFLVAFSIAHSSPPRVVK